MAARPGEDLVATLFADAHYFYGPPTAKPPHHRFDKGSYVYLFENSSKRRARIEVANYAGTPDQDAFNGYLDGAHVQYSYKQSNLVTLTVEGPNGQRNTPLELPEWHLPTFDPRNETKYMYKLHSADLYFWTKEDALAFLNEIWRIIPQQQITVLDEPTVVPSHVEDMSAVVQNLENVAITDPSYQQGHTRDSRSTSTTFPGPPISAVPRSQEVSNFAPLAYNPAAPAAPEAIQYREKTPPPEDGVANPLMAAASSDQGQSFGAPYQPPSFPGPPQQPQQQTQFPGPPAASAPPSQFSQPPPSAGLQSPYAQNFQNSFAPPPVAPTSSSFSTEAPPTSAPPAYQPQVSHIPVTQYANYPTSPGMPPPDSTPGPSTPGIYSPGFSSPSYQPSIYSPGAPPGGFAQYNYNSLSNTKPLMTDYSIHQQVYRPTEIEVASKNKKMKPPSGKLEQRAGQLEKGVGSFLKKLEKKIG